MILECPECHAKYVVPDRAIGFEGRTVRCAKCAHSWFAQMSEESKKEALRSGLETIIEEANGKTSEKKKPKPIPKGSNLPVRSAPPVSMAQKMATVVMLAVAVAAAVLYFSPGLVGYSPTSGLALSKVTMLDLPGGENPMVEISGTIINTSAAPIRVPTMRITLADKSGDALQYWEFSSDNSIIAPQKTLPFSTGGLEMRFSNGHHFVIDIGNALELTLRSQYAAAEQ